MKNLSITLIATFLITFVISSGIALYFIQIRINEQLNMRVSLLERVIIEKVLTN